MTELAPLRPAMTPPPAPLAMPEQDLWRAPSVRFPWPDAHTLAARMVVIVGTALLTVYGYTQMLAVFDPDRYSVLQSVLLGFVAVTFAWISFAATSALAGLLLPRPVPAREPRLRTRTALVMPLYNEDPAASLGALQAMAEGLVQRGAGGNFEVFVLSDTRDPDVWVRETAAIDHVRVVLGGGMAVWYRRRASNVGRKAGNIEDFVATWGGRYDHMLVLDADSLMEPATVIEMAARMQEAPRLGILQTVPILVGGRSLFARLQQFAGALHGPVVARGVAAWQGLDGNYWGHNALIRTRAFAESCGLPHMPGPSPFGGHILSHDFVEAALIRRAGWEVRMDTDLAGSYEGSPPSLLDLAARDRRWAQGNIQHLGVIAARGLRWPNRLHFAIGIGSYMMSPIWLGMMIVGVFLTLQAILMQPEYFPEAFQLFPTWPTFDASRMLMLFMVAMGLLLFPKLLGLASAVASRARSRAFGGRARLCAGFVAEILVSALYAPVLMLMQVTQVGEILRGRDSGWSAQTRDGGDIAWSTAMRRHAVHVAAGALPGVALAFLSPGQLYWLAPVLTGLVLAPVLSRVSASEAAGRRFAALGLLVTPGERRPPRLLARAATLRRQLAGRVAGLSLADLAREPSLRARHVATLVPAAPSDRLVWLANVIARAKIEAVENADAALALMSSEERLALAGNPQLIELLARRTLSAGMPKVLAGE